MVLTRASAVSPAFAATRSRWPRVPPKTGECSPNAMLVRCNTIDLCKSAIMNWSLFTAPTLPVSERPSQSIFLPSSIPHLPAGSTADLGGIARKPLYVLRIVAEAVAMACPSLDLQLNLLRRIVLRADGRDEVKLRLQPLDMLLALNNQVLEELPRAGIALLQTEGDPLFERGQGTRFQVQIPLQQ